MRIRTAAAAVLFALPFPALARAQAPADTTRPPTAKPADVASVDAIIAALYDVISGPAGQERDWTRFRSLFVPGARLIPTIHPPGGATPRTAVLTPEQYVERSAGLARNGFFEREISRTSDQFGAVTQIFSTYESRRAATDAKPFQRGINSIQLFNDGTRWYVVTIFWDGERADNPIPDKYLKR
jgi:hypothetical protein